MHKAVAMAQMYPVIRETLQAGGTVTLTSTGASMMPMLRHGEDTVTLEPAVGVLRINDIVLYRRDNGQFVLHRIVGMDQNGDYILRGDNQLTLEHHVRRQQVIGRLLAFTRKGRRIACTSVRYKAYVCLLPVLRALKPEFRWINRHMRGFGCFIRRREKENG